MITVYDRRSRRCQWVLFSRRGSVHDVLLLTQRMFDNTKEWRQSADRVLDWGGYQIGYTVGQGPDTLPAGARVILIHDARGG